MKIFMGVNLIKNIKICLFQKVGKSQNKVVGPEEVGWQWKLYSFEHNWPKKFELL